MKAKKKLTTEEKIQRKERKRLKMREQIKEKAEKEGRPTGTVGRPPMLQKNAIPVLVEKVKNRILNR
jgi:hypothetical protein